MEEESKQKSFGLSLKTIGFLTVVFAVFISSLLIGSLFFLSNQYHEVQESTSKYMSWKSTTLEVQLASDYLTDQVRSYVVTHKEKHMLNYFDEAEVAKRRERSLDEIEKYLGETQVFKNLKSAIDESFDLMNDEYYAMRLIGEATHSDISTFPEKVQAVVLTAEDIALSDEGKCDKAIEYVYGDNYINKKESISSDVDHAISALDNLMELSVLKSTGDLKNTLIWQQVLIGLNVLFLGGIIVLMFVYLIKPINRGVNCLINREEVPVSGLKEYRYIATTYNAILKQSVHNTERLVYEAEHDKLTGLYNRTGYDTIFHRIDLEKACYVLIDSDNFKEINDKYGHAVGDKVLIRVAKTLFKFFNSENSYVFRMGGDEFSIAMENADRSITKDLIIKLNNINQLLTQDTKNVPGISLSIGIAFGKEDDTTDSLFKKADIAMYNVKKHGRSGVAIYVPGMKA